MHAIWRSDTNHFKQFQHKWSYRRQLTTTRVATSFCMIYKAESARQMIIWSRNSDLGLALFLWWQDKSTCCDHCFEWSKKSGHVSKKIEIHLSKMNQPFFKYMMINSNLNATYCLIYFIDWTFPCVPIEVDLRYSKDNFLQKDVWLSTITSILKLMANLTFIQMSLNRYLLVGKDHSKFLVKAVKIHKKKYKALSLKTSVLLSIVVIFQEYFFGDEAIVQKRLVNNENYFYHQYSWDYTISSINHDNKLNAKTFLDDKLQKKLPSFFTLTAIRDFFSYFLFRIVITILYIMTIKQLRLVLKEKAHIVTTSVEHKDDDKAKAELRIIIMIVLNSLSNFLFRFPELISIAFF